MRVQDAGRVLAGEWGRVMELSELESWVRGVPRSVLLRALELARAIVQGRPRAALERALHDGASAVPGTPEQLWPVVRSAAIALPAEDLDVLAQCIRDAAAREALGDETENENRS